MKKILNLLIIVFNIILLYIYIFSCGVTENLKNQIDQVSQGYSVMVDESAIDIQKVFEIADDEEIVVIFTTVNYGGLIKYDYTYDIYNYDLVSDNIKFVNNDEIISILPFSKQHLNIIENDYTMNGSMSIYGEDISNIIKYFEDSNINYTINPIDEYSTFTLNILANGKTLFSFVLLSLISIIFILFTRRKEVAIHYIHGKNEFQIIKFQTFKILKIHIISVFIVSIIPIFYLFSLSTEHVFRYLFFNIIANLLFMISYIVLIFIVIPIIIKNENALEIIKGKKIISSSLSVLMLFLIVLSIVNVFSIDSAMKNFNRIQFYYNISESEKVHDLYALQGGSASQYNLSYNDNIDINSKVLYYEQNEYLWNNKEILFDENTLTFNTEFISDVDKNYYKVNCNMLNFLEIKDDNNKLINNCNKNTIYTPAGKYNDVKRKYPNYEIVKIKDNQNTFIPMGSSEFEFYANDAYYIVIDSIVSKEDFEYINVYEPGNANMFFHKKDIDKIKTQYFPTSSIISNWSSIYIYMEEEFIVYLNDLNSAIILLITYVISVIVYLRAFFKRYAQLINIYLINGKSIIPIIVLKNKFIILINILLLVYCILNNSYSFIFILGLQIITLIVEYINQVRKNYISMFKSEV